MATKLPIGVQSLENITSEDFIYVDKTQIIYNLINAGRVYFVARPRRFGKSLFISTLENIFKGNKELFKGLWIYNSDYDFKEYPVIKLSMSMIPSFGSIDEFSSTLKVMLNQVASAYEVQLDESLLPDVMLSELITLLYHKHNQKVVILIDEYDNPLINNLLDQEKALIIREKLKDFYKILKDHDQFIRFITLTGVSKCAKASVFSGLNNLHDISMSSKYANLFGYTQQELENYFASHIQDIADKINADKQEILAKIKLWYNGYRFSENPNILVYNPFSTLLFLSEQRFGNYGWFNTGIPKFLVDLLQNQNTEISQLLHDPVGAEIFGSFDLENISPLVLLVQTGYLTIKDYFEEFGRNFYMLGYPNYEVELSFTESLLKAFSYSQNGDSYIVSLTKSLMSGNMDDYIEKVKILFANIPYDLNINYEKYYQSIFFMIHKMIGFNVDVEVRTNKGRIDSVIQIDNTIYIFEFKLNGTATQALKQIKQNDYYQKYQSHQDNNIIILVGVSFDQKTRNITEYLQEEI